MSRWFHSMGFKLFAVLAGGVALLFAFYAALNLQAISKLWMESVERDATNTSELIERATHYGMLLNRKDDVHQTIRELAQASNISAIRIYDKQGKIMFSASQDEIGRQVDTKAEACVSCHAPGQPLTTVSNPKRTRTFRDADGNMVLALINPIENKPVCSQASCHAHPVSKTVLGVLDVQMSLSPLEQSIRSTRRTMTIAAILIMILIAGLSGLFIFQMIRKPIRRLVAGAKAVAEGDLTTQISVASNDEVGQLAHAFNRMVDRLALARAEITDWSNRLEQKVKEKTDALGKSQRQVQQMEKMASLGKLAASVAHEINNPMAGILNYAKLVNRSLTGAPVTEKEQEEIRRYLGHIQHEAGRCGDIVRNLLLFSKRTDFQFSPQSIGTIIQRSLMVVQHHMQMRNISLSFPPPSPGDELLCDGNQIEQALVALFVNAAEAMPDGGILRIGVTARENDIGITIQDTGAGISPEDLPHIFEPFFSTKEESAGVGLGLAVVFGIIQKHGGKIDVTSEVGKGTTFTIALQRRAP